MIYILFGEDEARSSYKLEEIKKKHAGEYSDLIRFDFREDETARILDELDSSSLFMDTKLVIVDHADFMARKTPARPDADGKKPGAAKTAGAKKRKKKEPSAQEELIRQFALRDPEDKIIVYLVPSKSLSQAVKLNFGKAVYIESQSLDEKSVRSVVSEIAKSKGVSLEPKAMDWFCSNVGLNSLRIESELEKLSLYSNTITLEDVRALVTAEPSDNVFEMSNALFSRRGLDLLRLYREFRAQNMEPVAINALLASQIRFVYQVRVLMDLRYSQQEIAERLGVKPGRVYFAMKNAHRFQAAQLLGHLNTLAEVDWNMKSGKMDKDAGFENFVLRMLQER